MADFSVSDIDEAKRRVQEMRNRAKSFVDQPVTPTPVSQPEHKSIASSPPIDKSLGSSENGIMNGLFNSSDSSLILALVMILSREGADNMLILALLYILL
ncbi:MAG: hypothetical protein ACI4IG_01215 [Eubacterium sp.]